MGRRGHSTIREEPLRVPQQGLGLTFHPGLFDGEHSL
jgi:hypothetical protein